MGKADKLIKDASKAEKEGKFRMAFNLLQEASKEDPKNKEIWFNMGRICLKEKLDMNNALDYFMKALELDQNNPAIWLHIAETCAGLKRWPQASKAYEKAIQLQPPKDLDIYMKLAETYEYNQQIAQALQCYQRLLKIDGAYIEAWNKMARGFIELGDFEHAKGAANKVLQLDPQNYNAQNVLGIAYNMLGDFLNAEKAFGLAISLKPRVAMGYEKLGELYINMQKEPEALFCYERAGELGDIMGIQMAKELKAKGIQPQKPSVIK